MTSPNTLEVLQRRESCRDSTTRPWSFSEAEFPLDARVAPVEVSYDSAVCPLITLETARQNRSMLLLNEKNVTIQKFKKFFVKCTKQIFMSIKNESYYA